MRRIGSLTACGLVVLLAGCGTEEYSSEVAMEASTSDAAYYPAPPAAPAVVTAQYPDAKPNPVRRTAEQPLSTFSIDVDTTAYAVVRRFLKQGDRPPSDAVRVEELVNYFDYDYPLASASEVFKPFVSVVPSPWSPGKRIVHVALTGHDVPDARPPLNLVFLVDVSGSMEPEDRLPLAKKALEVLVDQLRPQDHVAIAVYAGAAGAVLEPTSGAEKSKIRGALRRLEAGGSTAGAEGLALAYEMARENFRKDAVNRVILMTDGDFNVGVVDEGSLEDFVAEQRKTGVYLSAYGFGQENYQDRRMQAISQSGNGTAGYIDSLDEARKLFRDDFTGSIFPIADDVKIQVEFNPAKVSEWRLIGYETRLLAREDFNNDRVDAGEIGAGATVTALYEITAPGGPESVDPLRYGEEKPAPSLAAGGEEIAFLRYRFKRPGGETSIARSAPITEAAAHESLDSAPEPTRWALAVAAYGQLLKGDTALGRRFGWQEVQALAQGARGDDPDGLRAEFIRLVRAAAGLDPTTGRGAEEETARG